MSIRWFYDPPLACVREWVMEVMIVVVHDDGDDDAKEDRIRGKSRMMTKAMMKMRRIYKTSSSVYIYSPDDLAYVGLSISWLRR